MALLAPSLTCYSVCFHQHIASFTTSPFLGPPTPVFRESAHLVQPKVFTCFPAVIYVFGLGLVVCSGFSPNSQHIHVKLVCTQFTGEAREAPGFRFEWSVPSVQFQLQGPFQPPVLFLAFSFDFKKNNNNTKLRQHRICLPEASHQGLGFPHTSL